MQDETIRLLKFITYLIKPLRFTQIINKDNMFLLKACVEVVNQ